MTARALIVHNLAHARAALSAAGTLGVPVVLMSAAGAAAYAGAPYFLEFTGRAMAEHPESKARTVLDCGAEPGLALGALSAGCPAILAGFGSGRHSPPPPPPPDMLTP